MTFSQNIQANSSISNLADFTLYSVKYTPNRWLTCNFVYHPIVNAYHWSKIVEGTFESQTKLFYVILQFSDPEFIQFLESLDKEEEKLPSAEIYIEEIEAAKAIDKNSKYQALN